MIRLTRIQDDVLRSLLFHPVSDGFGIELRVVRRLEQLGLCTVVHGAKWRRWTATITDAGRAMLPLEATR